MCKILETVIESSVKTRSLEIRPLIPWLLFIDVTFWDIRRAKIVCRVEVNYAWRNVRRLNVSV